MRVLVTLAFIISLFGFLHAGWEFAVARSISQINAEAEFVSGEASRYHIRSVEEELASLYSRWQELSEIAANVAQVKHQLGRSTLALSAASRQTEDKIEYFCDAIEHFAEAARLSPHQARYHISWADLEVQLKSPERICNMYTESNPPSSPLDAEQRLAWARELAPHSTVDLYLASLVYLRAADKPQALSLLKLNQEINPHFTAAQREYVYTLIRSKQELAQAIPRRYPEVLHWIAHFARYREADYLNWNKTFVAALGEALEEVRGRFRNGKIDANLYAHFIKSINSLPLVADSEKLRRELDQLLSNVYEVEGNKDWSKVLKARQDLLRIPILKALIGDDKQPKQTMLFSWVPDNEYRTAQLDVLGRSLGIYIPRGYHPRMLILQANSGSARLGKNSLQFLASQDNLVFHPLQTNKLTQSQLVDGKETLVIEFPKADFRYLKIRYLGSNRSPLFTNRFSDLIQLYGEKI